MLKLINIKKDYLLKDQEPVHALKGISLNFRQNEFVAILGHSGCGKTTLLNIIGGLDRYSDGDLHIAGKSTKNYDDSDWDTYRNHSVGFVFQSYNLIPHQSIEKNVELALTIAGVGEEERHQRAEDALAQVGLKGLGKKKPNQLSGGQMQRVAIARALVNNPEIVLADEPTGALDSETSVQIMDLLKEVAKNHLVIMVTHNPELAERYATRIIKMKDGLIVDDSLPCNEEVVINNRKENTKKSAMKFVTATRLSFSNLLSKLKRTVLIAVAGSIGIIGVSTVLSVSNGMTDMITGLQDDMLSYYPLTISEQSIDYSTLVQGLSGWENSKITEFDLNTSVGVESMISYLITKYKDFTSVKTNDINSNLLQYISQIPEGSVASTNLDYGLDLTNNIFTSWKRSSTDNKAAELTSLSGLTQMYITELGTVKDFSEYSQFMDLFTGFMKQTPGDEEYILSQYDLLGGHYASEENEIMLVVDPDNQTLTDLNLGQLGYFTEDEFINIAKRATEENKTDTSKMSEAEYQAFMKKLDEKYPYPKSYTIEELLNKEMAYYPHDTIWEYKSTFKNFVSFSFKTKSQSGSEQEYKLKLEFSEETPDSLKGSLNVAGYTLSCTFIRQTERDPSNPVLGTWSTTILGDTFSFTLKSDGYVYSNEQKICQYQYTSELVTGYTYPATAQEDWEDEKVTIKVAGVLKAKSNIKFGSMDRGVYYSKALGEKYMKDSLNSQIVNDPDHGLKAYIGSDAEKQSTYHAYVTFKYTSYEYGNDYPIPDVSGYAHTLNTSFSSSVSSMLSTTETTSDVDKAYLRSLAGLASKQVKTEEGSITYKFEQLPQKISIYPKNFETKDTIKEYLNKWNADGDIILHYPSGDVTLKKDQRDELTVNDTVEMIITTINSLITAVTVALVAFTSLSLVVSCFMIAVITYISTMERIKEIGVIRSLGGRKKDVSRLFIAECLITGLASGVIGVAVTYVLSLVLNLAVIPFNIGTIASLPIYTALIMIALSIALNVLSGLIPSMKASRQDPVVALRSE